MGGWTVKNKGDRHSLIGGQTVNNRGGQTVHNCGEQTVNDKEEGHQ